MKGARGTILGKAGTPARPEQYDTCACGAVKRRIAVVCRSCYLSGLNKRAPRHVPVWVPTENLQAFLSCRPTRPLSRALERATGKPAKTWERWITRVKRQRWVSPRVLDEFASALDLHVSMFERSA